MAEVWLVLFLSPIQVALSIWFLFKILGWSAIVGLAVMILWMPMPAYMMRVMRGVQVERMRKTDERVQAVAETMSILRMVKIFGWESRMSARMATKRKEELKVIRKDKMLSLVTGHFNFLIPILTMIAAYSVYTSIMKQALTASIVFSSMAVFELFRLQLRQVLLAIPIVIQGKVSADRLDNFLKNTGLLDSLAPEPRHSGNPAAFEGMIGFRMASFSWTDEPDTNFKLEVKNELIFRSGTINLITGPTGSGKTSMLLALLGEMRFTPLAADSWFGIDRTKGIAYAPQESWLQNTTIRENVLMGGPHDEERYRKVLHECGLTPDLALFESGDLTVVGERGLTLSGGQKARITLARCLYSTAKILLLDDPLAALDVQTATWIVEKCFASDLIEGRTILLVTHNIPLASRIARFMAILAPDGSIQQGPLDAALVATASVIAASDEPSENRRTGDSSKAAVETTGKVLMTEEVAEGHVKWAAFKLYLSSLSGYPLIFWVALLGGIALNEISIIVQAWFLGYWSTQYEDRPAAEISPAYYLSIYALILASSILFYSWYFTVFTFGSLRASRVIHNRLMRSIVGCTMRWLDLTPTSRVLARATQDMRTVDDSMAVACVRVLQLTIGLSTRFGTVVLFSPAFVIPGLLITLIGGLFGQMFMKAQLPVKREMSNARSPILGHLSAIMAGLPSIRAYGAQELFLQESLTRIDRYTRTAITYQNLNRWIACRSDFLGGTFTTLLAAYLVYIRREDAATTGFLLNNAFGYSMMVLVWVRYFNTAGLNGNSLERILDYINVEQQQDPTRKVTAPPAFWPASGHLLVKNLTARYSEDGPPVLRNISFEVRAGERVGVVGRTGSGKSSLVLALLRCLVTEGSVTYDGVLTNSLDLNALRSKITIVPQVIPTSLWLIMRFNHQPELLRGTLRSNLDPFGEYEDAILHDALRSAGFYELQDAVEEGGQHLTLESAIASGGTNLSTGQRQILALARAIVRDSKLLILDEATSAIDYETDAAIQSALRHELRSDVTVITIAHRLQTIMDFDRIMVLQAGEIVEFDAPSTLLQQQDGYLRALVEESGDREVLRAMTERS